MSRKPQAPISLFLTLCLALGVTACAHSPASLKVQIPEALKAECKVPPGDDVKTVGDLASHDLRTAAELKVCDAKRSALVSILDAVNGALAPRKRWPW